MTGSIQTPFFLPALSLVIGGARSGKSRFAEGLVVRSGLPRWYLATAQAWDAEMAVRIGSHRTDRGPDWQTVEEPLAVAAALRAIPAGGVVLLDCATLWLTNHLLKGHDLEGEASDLLFALMACPSPVVVVSNEVGWSIVPDNAMAREFRDAQGRLNQQLAAQAGLVVAVMAGLPIVLKGAL